MQQLRRNFLWISNNACRQSLAAEAAAIQAINVTEDFVKAVEVMQACSGKILTTGIGKAGHIAKKFAATLCSTATPADFVHPAEAAHGDLGIVGNDDVLIAFSTSGKSREVIEILEMARHLRRVKDYRRHLAPGL